MRLNRLPNFSEDVKIKKEVMYGVEDGRAYLLPFIQMAKVAAGEILAGVALTGLIHRPGVIRVFFVLDDNPAFAGEESAVSGIAGGEDTVKKIHPSFHTF